MSNCFQNSSDKSNLFKIFDFFKHSKIIFFASLSGTEQSSPHMKLKIKDVLSVSVKF